MLTPDQKSKLFKRYKKLADYITENEISKNDILDLMLENPTFQIYRDIVGSVSDYFEWREHPTMPTVECSTQGDIRISGNIIKPTEYRGDLVVVISKSKTKRIRTSAASLILGTFTPPPSDGTYIPRFRNHNSHDLRISNLYWYKLVE